MKSFRQAQILRIIRRRPMFTQEELALRLASAGIETSQVTLSRDIRELGLVKTADGYRERTAIQRQVRPRENLQHVVQEFLRDLEIAQNVVVLKTSPGSAPTVALALDAEEWPDVVGTVAGDDTIFAATRSTACAKRVRKKLLELW